jgi:hypothetical protein
MRIARTCVDRDRRRIETAGGEFKDRPDLPPRYIVLPDDFLHARTHLKVFKDGSDRHPGIAKHPNASLRRSGTLSTTGHAPSLFVFNNLN